MIGEKQTTTAAVLFAVIILYTFAYLIHEDKKFFI